MTRTKKKPAPPCQAATGLPLINLQLASYGMEDTAGAAFRQDLPDPVAILAARARVSLPTARLFAELNCFGGR